MPFGGAADSLLCLKIKQESNRKLGEISEDIVLMLRKKIESLPKGDDLDFTFRMAAALHAIIFSKEMTAESNSNMGWDTNDAIEHAGEAEWGYSCWSIPEITTIMRSGVVFFSNNKKLTLVNPDMNRIVSIIKPFSDIKNLKIAAALYRSTVHSEDAYATVAKICDKSGVPAERVKDCLEREFGTVHPGKRGCGERISI